MKEQLAIFEKAYLNNTQIVLEMWSLEMQHQISVHNTGWDVGSTDFKNYLYLSVDRYKVCYEEILRSKSKRICDIGGFWGVFALTLVDLGYDVTITEATEFYSESFAPLFNLLRSKGVLIMSENLFEPLKIPQETKFDLITVLAVLEHFPHSPKDLFTNIKSLLRKDGRLLIEVPNILYFPKRMDFLKGKSPLAPMKVINESAIPFIGHHHEYTFAEVIYLETFYGFTHERESFINYSDKNAGFFYKIKHPLQSIAYFFFPQSRELIFSTSSMR